MNTQSIYLLKLLKAYVLDEAPESYTENYLEVLQLAQIHSILGIVGYMIMNHSDEYNQYLLPDMKRTCFSTIGMQSYRYEAMKRLITQMNQAGIDHLLFKGFIVRDYYKIPELRTYGDIDFLIRKEDRKKSDDLMISLGYERKTDWEPVYSYYKGQEYYEIHTDVMEVDVSNKADYKGYYQHVWEHAVSTSEHTYELEPEYHLLYLLTHIAKHINNSGAGIRMYLDIAFFIQHFGNTLDYNYFRNELKKLEFTDFANMVFTVVQEYLGVASPIPLKKIDSQVLEDFMEYTMAGGVFGYYARDKAEMYLTNQDKDGEDVSRIKTLLSRLFPGVEALQKRYTYLQGRPYLLPIAWIHRIFKTRDSWGYHAKQAQTIMSADEKEALKLRKIYKEIGL